MHTGGRQQLTRPSVRLQDEPADCLAALHCARNNHKEAAMKPWIRKSLIVAAGALAVLAGAYYWLIVESSVPRDAHFALDIQELRALANATPGDKPQSIEIEKVAMVQFPATAIVAGDGWDKRDLPIYSYRLVYPQDSLIIDTAMDREIGGASLALFDDDAYARMQAAMERASSIVITHEHMDHIGGIAASKQLPKLLTTTRLTREQIADPDRSAPAKFPDRAFENYQPLEYERVHAAAPGVVLIRAAGHTPGSQMVYVQTANGAEYLFLGDVVWHMRNIDVQRERARLVTWLFLKEDRDAVFGQMAALKRLREAEPSIHVVPGHDGGIIDGLIERGALRVGFTTGS